MSPGTKVQAGVCHARLVSFGVKEQLYRRLGASFGTGTCVKFNGDLVAKYNRN